MEKFKYTLSSAEEAEAKALEEMAQGNQELTGDERDYVIRTDQERFVEWDRRLLHHNKHIIGYNQAMSEEATQFGVVPGVNSGNGQFEGRISMHLFLALGAKYKDPEWYTDDRKFEAFLKEHTELDGRPGKHNSKGGIAPTRDQLING